MINHDEALGLLKKYNCNEFIMKHSLAVNKLAIEIAKKLIKRGVKINLELVDAGSLLHDIGMSVTGLEGKANHGKIGAEIMVKEGLDNLSGIVGGHGLLAVFDKYKLKSWEEKIVFYADKIVEKEKTVTLNERIDSLIKKYPDEIERIKKARPLAIKIEKEIMGALNGN